jgi:hypothetical protein
MLFIYNKQQTGEAYNTLFKHYKAVIAEHLAVFDKEDINGWDCGHLQVTLWYGSFLYAVMLQNEQKRGFLPLSELKRIYLYDSTKSCLQCRKIPLPEMLKLLDIDLDSIPRNYGIERMAVEVNNLVEDCQCIPVAEDISMDNYIGTPESIAMFNQLWESESYCEILLNSSC